MLVADDDDIVRASQPDGGNVRTTSIGAIINVQPDPIDQGVPVAEAIAIKKKALFDRAEQNMPDTPPIKLYFVMPNDGAAPPGIAHTLRSLPDALHVEEYDPTLPEVASGIWAS